MVKRQLRYKYGLRCMWNPFLICIDNNDSFNIINFLILFGKHFINWSINNMEPLYFIKLLSLLKDKSKNVIYIKQVNSQYVKDWERDLADALYSYSYGYGHNHDWFY